MAQSLETDYSSSMEDAQENPHQALRSSHFSHEIPEKNEYSPIDSSSYFQLLQLWKKDPPDSIGTNSKGQEKHIHIPNKVKLSLSFGTILFLAGCAPGVVGGVAAVPGENISMNGSDGKNVAITEIMPQPSENAVSSTPSEVSTYTIGVTNADITPSSTQSVKKTEITPSSTPAVTETQVKTTEGETKVEQEDWFNKHFLPEKKLPKGAILMNNLTREQVQKLTITGPGQVYGRCHLKDAVNDYKERNKLLCSVRIDLAQKNGNFCVTQATSEKTIRNGISKDFPDLPLSKQEELVNQYVQQSQNWMRRIIDLPYEPYSDLFETFTFRNDVDENGKVIGTSLHIFDTYYPPTGEYPDRESITIPFLTPTSTPTP